MLAQQTRRVRGDTQRVWSDHDGHAQDRLNGLRREGRPFDDLEQSFFEAEVGDDDGDRALSGASTALPALRATDLDDDDDARAFTARKRAVRMRLGGLVAAGLAAGALVGFGVPRLAARIHGAQGLLPAASIPAAAPVAAVPAKQTSAPASAAAQVARPTAPATAGAIITMTEVTVPEVPDPEPIGGASAPRAPAAAAADDEPAEAAPLKDVVWSDREQALVPAASATAAPESAAPPSPPVPPAAAELEAPARP